MEEKVGEVMSEMTGVINKLRDNLEAYPFKDGYASRMMVQLETLTIYRDKLAACFNNKK